jgi:hypothetical protein
MVGPRPLMLSGCAISKHGDGRDFKWNGRFSSENNCLYIRVHSLLLVINPAHYLQA